MPDGARSFLQRWFVTTVGVLLAATLIDGVRADTMVALLATSLLLGILNAVLRPILLIVALPLLIVTLGLFTFVINAFLLYFAAHLVKGFYVADFWAAFKGSLLISLVSLLANSMIGKKEVRAPHSPRPPPRPPAPPPNTGSGPVIDI